MTETLPTVEPEYDVATPLDTDFYLALTDVSDAEKDVWRRARAFALEPDVLPRIREAWDRHEYPLDLVARLGQADLLRDGVPVDGLPEISRVAAGLAMMELSRLDGSIATMTGVQGGLAMRSIQLCGSEEQRAEHLPAMARGELYGAFALTEPTHGSDSVSLETRAERVDGGWRLHGHKKWIGNGAAGGVTVVWARSAEDEKVRGFIVRQESEGYTAEVIKGKVALRAIDQAHITLDGVFVPDADVLPEARSFKDTSRVLFATRVGVAWSALGKAVGCYEAAVQYAGQRVQFGKPIAGHQLVQGQLATMLADVTNIKLTCFRLLELQDQGRLTGPMASLAKMSAARQARRVTSMARDILGGNGLLLENHVARHLTDMEVVYTYEGTDSMQSLIVGRAITGVSAFA